MERKRVGGLKLDDLPGLEALQIGEVVDGPDDNLRRPVLDGIEYDYVFDVDIGDGEPIRKLPYNRSDNPYATADKWLLKENLPLSYRQQIVEFILQNSGQKDFTLDSSFRDPFTGSSAYIPGATSSMSGTFIDQGEDPDFYFQKYPEDNPVLGFFTWRWVLTLGFDHMYSSPVFLGTLVLLGASLMAYTYTTQIPLVKVARRWNFLDSSEAIRKQEYSDTLPRASVRDLGVLLMGAGYEVFLKGPSLYAFKGLAGPTGFLSTPTDAFNTEVHINRFYMDYYDSGEVSQFHTDLSLFDLDGKEKMRKTISVNDPLRYGGVTIYQTDWSFSALQILKDDEGPFNLAMAPLQINGEKKLFGTFLPVGDAESPNVKGISMLARDLQSIVIYDLEGKFSGVRRPGSKLPIDIDGSRIVIVDAIGSSGLDLMTDPGVPIVYAGFGALMLTTCISFLSHSRIWALQDGTMVIVGGKTNRAKAEFPEEMDRLLDRVPEIVESSRSKEPDKVPQPRFETQFYSLFLLNCLSSNYFTYHTRWMLFDNSDSKDREFITALFLLKLLSLIDGMLFDNSDSKD
uniref:PFU domain-containing protein n=1 Tax=Quercus lobata TaxID=97700 RepID=A0A7N2MY97_QUELO